MILSNPTEAWDIWTKPMLYDGPIRRSVVKTLAVNSGGNRGLPQLLRHRSGQFHCSKGRSTMSGHMFFKDFFEACTLLKYREFQIILPNVKSNKQTSCISFSEMATWILLKIFKLTRQNQWQTCGSWNPKKKQDSNQWLPQQRFNIKL